MNYQDPFGFSHESISEDAADTDIKENLSNKGMGWISFLRVLAWFQFAAIIIGGFVLGSVFSNAIESLVGILVCGFIVGPLIAFSSTALIMILLDAAENLIHIKRNTDHIAKHFDSK